MKITRRGRGKRREKGEEEEKKSRETSTAECIHEIRACSFQLFPVFRHMRGSDSLCVSYTPMTKGEIWVGSSQNVLLCLPPLLSSPLLSTYVRAAPSPPPPPSRPSVISARAFVINIKVPRSRGGARSGRIADSNATVALSGKTGWRKAGVDRVPVYYLAGLQPAARLTSCLFILGTVFFFFLFFLLFFFYVFFLLFSLSLFFLILRRTKGGCARWIYTRQVSGRMYR